MASAIIFSFFLLRFLRLQPVLWLFFLLAPFAIALSARGGGSGEPSIQGRRGGARHCEQNHTRMANYVKICTGFDRLQLK